MKATCVALLLLALTGCAEWRGAGREIKETGKVIGHGVRDTAKEVGKGAREAAKELGKATGEAAREVREEVKDED